MSKRRRKRMRKAYLNKPKSYPLKLRDYGEVDTYLNCQAVMNGNQRVARGVRVLDIFGMNLGVGAQPHADAQRRAMQIDEELNAIRHHVICKDTIVKRLVMIFAARGQAFFVEYNKIEQTFRRSITYRSTDRAKRRLNKDGTDHMIQWEC